MCIRDRPPARASFNWRSRRSRRSMRLIFRSLPKAAYLFRACCLLYTSDAGRRIERSPSRGLGDVYKRQTPRPSVIQLAIKEKSALYAAYIPLFAQGGIFIPSVREYELGDDIYVLLSLSLIHI